MPFPEFCGPYLNYPTRQSVLTGLAARPLHAWRAMERFLILGPELRVRKTSLYCSVR